MHIYRDQGKIIKKKNDKIVYQIFIKKKKRKEEIISFHCKHK